MTPLAQGAWAASLTPFNEDLGIDAEGLCSHIRWLLANGCSGAAVLGTTGEANSMSLRERLDIVDALRRHSFSPDRIMIGTGCCAAPDTIELTRAVLDAGYGNVLMLPPFYYKAVSDDGMYAYFAHVFDSVADNRLRVIIYDIPALTGLTINIQLLARLREAFPNTVVGVKNSSGNWDAIQETCERLPGFAVFAGTEQFLLATLRTGGAGCISATANVTCGKLARIVENCTGDGVDALQEEATRVRLSLQMFPAIPALKELVAHLSRRAAWRHLRMPWVSLNPSETATLLATARRLDLLPELVQ